MSEATTVDDWSVRFRDSLLVFLGGGAGATVRFWLGRLVSAPGGFPWGTFGINVVGSFALGFLVILCKDRPGWLALLGDGVCGGFTTFSAFSVETLRLMESEAYTSAAGYVCGSVAFALMGAWIGMQLAKG